MNFYDFFRGWVPKSTHRTTFSVGSGPRSTNGTPNWPKSGPNLNRYYQGAYHLCCLHVASIFSSTIAARTSDTSAPDYAASSLPADQLSTSFPSIDSIACYSLGPSGARIRLPLILPPRGPRLDEVDRFVHIATKAHGTCGFPLFQCRPRQFPEALLCKAPL